jgi:Cupredoxin-like domain
MNHSLIAPPLGHARTQMPRSGLRLTGLTQVGMQALVLALAGGFLGQAAHAAEEASFEIVARDGRFLPDVLEVPAGVKLKLVLRNEGKTPVEFENLELRVEKVLAPNSASRVTVQPLKPGTYILMDDLQAEPAKMRLIAR